MRFLHTAIGCVLAAGLAACSGAGNASFAPPAQQYAPAVIPQQPTSNSRGTAPHAASPSLWGSHPSEVAAITLTGSIRGTFSGGFSLYGGNSCGTVRVYTASSTAFSGPHPAAGETARVTGPGSCASSIDATTVAVSTAGSSSTMTHVLTEDYLGTPYGTTKIAWSQAAPYLSWAQVSVANADAVHSEGIKTQFYVDPNRTEAGNGDPLYNGNESTFSHNCSGERSSQPYDGLTEYVMQIGGSAMQSLFATYVNSIATQAHFDSLFEDQAGALSAYAPYSSMPCGYSDSAWLSANVAIDQVSKIPIIFNGLSGFNGEGPSLSLSLLSGSNTVGGTLEHCFTDTSTLKQGSWPWTATENTELEVAAKDKIFVCMERNTNAASSSTDERLYAYASFLLTYNPNTSVIWEEFNPGASGLHVLPESGIVALDPAVAAPASVSSLEQPGGSYARQYGACYYRGSSVGACAVVVNPGSRSVPMPYAQYHHAMVLAGGGVLDGGTVSTEGSAPTSLGPLEAAIVFP